MSSDPPWVDDLVELMRPIMVLAIVAEVLSHVAAIELARSNHALAEGIEWRPLE